MDLLYWGGFFFVREGFSFFGGVLVISEFLVVVGATVSASLLVWGFS